jgi:hypothetical protein
MQKNRWLILLIMAGGTLFGWSWAYTLRDFPSLRLLCFSLLGIAVLAAWLFKG